MTRLTRTNGLWAALAGALGLGGAYYARRRNRQVAQTATQNGHTLWRTRRTPR